MLPFLLDSLLILIKPFNIFLKYIPLPISEVMHDIHYYFENTFIDVLIKDFSSFNQSQFLLQKKSLATFSDIIMRAQIFKCDHND